MQAGGDHRGDGRQVIDRAVGEPAEWKGRPGARRSRAAGEGQCLALVEVPAVLVAVL